MKKLYSAALAGVSLDELLGLHRHIKGEQASPAITGIRQAISAIVKPSDDAQASLNQFGIITRGGL